MFAEGMHARMKSSPTLPQSVTSVTCVTLRFASCPTLHALGSRRAITGHQLVTLVTAHEQFLARACPTLVLARARVGADDASFGANFGRRSVQRLR